MAFLGATYLVTLEDVDDALGAGFTHLRFYRMPTETATPALVYSAVLVSGTSTYTYNDTGAEDTDWWTWSLWGSVPGESQRAEPQPVSTTRVTRKQLRREVGYRLGLLELVTVDSATTTSVTSSALVDPDRSVHEIGGGWVYLPSGEIRRVRTGSNGYNTTTGTLTWAPAATAPSANDEVEVWSGLIKLDIVSAIHRAMRVARFSLMQPEYTLIEVVEGEDEYPLPYNAVHGRVIGVDLLSGGSWVRFTRWEQLRNGQQPWIRFQSVWPGQVFRVQYNTIPDVLDDDNDSWDVPLEIATAQVAKQLLHSLLIPSAHREMLQDIAIAVKALEEEAMLLRQAYISEMAVPLVQQR